jgi:hypothetical protein
VDALANLKNAVTPNGRINGFQTLFQAAKRARLPYDKDTWLNTAFFLNLQYTRWNADVSTIEEIPRPPELQNAPRPVSNKIMHFVQSELADVLQQRPTVDVLPATEDPNDISNANVALAYLKWLAGPLNADFDGVLAEAALWALAGTEGYIKWVWNPRLDNGKGRGDIVSCSPLDIYPDPYAKRFKDCRYVIHSQFLDTEQVYDTYGVEVQQQDIEKADPNKIALMREMGMAPVLTGVQVQELWMKPNRRYPDGLYAVWTGHQFLVEPTDFPYNHGRLPFTQIGSVRRPGSLHYTSAVTFLRQPQMELNKYHAQMIQIREAFANPKWFIPSEMEMEADPDDSPNQILKGNTSGGMLKPMIIQGTAMPENDDGAFIVNEMEDIVGVHDVSNAQAPGRVESGSAISMLQDADDTRLAELTRTIGLAITEGYYQQLMLARQYHNTEQIVTSYSSEGIAEVNKFLGTNMDPGMHINVQMGTGLSTNRAARIQQAMTLWQNQIITNNEQMAELLDVPISSIAPDNAYDIRLARNENYTMEAGVPITPNSWDNHDIHRREHNNYRKTHEYALLPTKTKAMFEYHVQLHDQLEMTQLGEQMKIQQIAGMVAQGVGFQQAQEILATATGAPPGAPQPGPAGATPSGAPSAAPPPGQPQTPGGAAGGQGNGSHPTPINLGGNHSPVTATGAGAQAQYNVDSVRQSPQSGASFIRRYANTLSR